MGDPQMSSSKEGELKTGAGLSTDQTDQQNKNYNCQTLLNPKGGDVTTLQ